MCLQQKRRDQIRQAALERELENEQAQAAFVRKRDALTAAEESKTAKRRAKRQKLKDKRKANKGAGAGAGQGGSGSGGEGEGEGRAPEPPVREDSIQAPEAAGLD